MKIVLILFVFLFCFSCDDNSGKSGVNSEFKKELIYGTWNVKETIFNNDGENKSFQRKDNLVFNEDGTMDWFGRYPPFLNSSTYYVGEASGTWAFSNENRLFEYSITGKIRLNDGDFTSSVTESFKGEITKLSKNELEYFFDSTYESGLYYSNQYILKK